MTKRRLRLAWILGFLIILLALAGLAGYRRYEARFAWIGQTKYEKTIETLDRARQPVEDLEQLRAFENLKQIDLRETGLTCEEYDRVRSWFPDAQILWDIPFQGAFYSMDTQELTVTSLKEEDLAALRYFTGLKTVSAENCPDYPVLHQLRQQRPELQVTYSVPVAGELYSWDVKQLALPGAETAALAEVLPFLTELEALELIAPLAPAEELLALVEALPQVAFSWNLEVGGIAVNEKTETLDLTGIPMTVEEMEAVLPYLLSLTYVDMTDCGISNEEMDALNRRHENVKIVWTVDIGNVMRVRTDATWFMPGKWYYRVGTRDVYNLRYCTDMICVDIGHMPVDNCEWARYMPKLKYFLICDTDIRDISPIAGLQELVYVEIFTNDILDYSPLLECPALEDLNLHFTYGDPNIIKQLTWVNNIWWRNIYLTEEERQMLRDALPNVHFEFWSIDATGAGWRQLKNYYDQRDLMGVPYMD